MDRADLTARLVRAYRDGEHCGGEAYAWRRMDAHLVTALPVIVAGALGPGPVAIADVLAVLDDVKAARDAAADQIATDGITRRHLVGVPDQQQPVA